MGGELCFVWDSENCKNCPFYRRKGGNGLWGEGGGGGKYHKYLNIKVGMRVGVGNFSQGV